MWGTIDPYHFVLGWVNFGMAYGDHVIFAVRDKYLLPPLPVGSFGGKQVKWMHVGTAISSSKTVCNRVDFVTDFGVDFVCQSYDLKVI